jgi:hypothetical protein
MREISYRQGNNIKTRLRQIGIRECVAFSTLRKRFLVYGNGCEFWGTLRTSHALPLEYKLFKRSGCNLACRDIGFLFEVN